MVFFRFQRVDKIALQISVPQNNSVGPLAFEQLLASLHGVLSSCVESSISFELVGRDGGIEFLAIVPNKLKNTIADRIYANYPEARITEAEDWIAQNDNGNIWVGNVVPSGPFVFPFKRHPQFESRMSASNFEDPLSGLLAGLSANEDRDRIAVIQFVVGPVSPAWNRLAMRVLPRFFNPSMRANTALRQLYAWSRLSPKKSTRILRAPVWVLLSPLIGRYEPTCSCAKPDQHLADRDSQTSGRHDRETVYSACFDKLTRLAFGVSVKIVLKNGPSGANTKRQIREIAGAFQQFSIPETNVFRLRNIRRLRNSKPIERRHLQSPFILSQEELATMVHLPTETVQNPELEWVKNRQLPPPPILPAAEEPNVAILGQTLYRNTKKRFGVRPSDRRRHVYIIGKTGMGKSTLLENLIFADIHAGNGVAVIDPHGDLAEAVLRFVPKHRSNDVILFDPADTEFPIAFNLLESVNACDQTLIASGLVAVIKKLHADSWGPRLEHFLRNTILTLTQAPNTTMLAIPRLLVDETFRRQLLKHVDDPMVRSFWTTEFSALAPTKLAEAVGPIQNKIGQFLATPTIRNIVGQPKSTVNLRWVMDNGKILIVNLSKGRLGEDNSMMLGSLLVSKLQIDAMSRADVPQEQRRDFHLYVDEFQNFVTGSFPTILSEARKYRLSLTMANQYLDQLSPEVASAVFGNVGTMAAFQVGVDDAARLAEQFDPDRVSPTDLANLPKYQILCRLMVDGLTTPAFSASTLPPPIIGTVTEKRIQSLRDNSRQRYSKPRAQVEEKIERWTQRR